MDDRKLEVLIAAVEAGSFNKAAQKCHCTQSAVTQTINAVEAELGCKVVERSHAGVTLTEEGARLLPALRQAHEGLMELKLAADKLSEGDTLCVGAYSSIARAWLPRFMRLFQEREPDVRFETVIGSSGLAEMLRDGRIDVLICDDWLFNSTLGDTSAQAAGKAACKWMPLFEEVLLVAVPASLGYKPGQTIERGALFDHPYLFNPDYIYGHYQATRITSLVKVRTDDASALLAMVAEGMGVTVLPEMSLGDVPKGVTVLKVDPPDKRIIGVALPPDARMLARRFADLLVH